MKGPVQLPDGRFAKILWQNDDGTWQIQVTSKVGRGERDAYPARMLQRVDSTKWSEISGRRPNRQASSTCQWCQKNKPDGPGICSHCHRFPTKSLKSAPGACPDCQTPPPSYRSGVPCPNCEYQEHSFKQWLEDTTSSMGAYGNEEDPDEHGLKRIGHLRRPVPGSEMADKLFGVKHLRKSSKPRRSSRPVLSSLRRPNEPRT
jgi:hypothetical protein